MTWGDARHGLKEERQDVPAAAGGMPEVTDRRGQPQLVGLWMTFKFPFFYARPCFPQREYLPFILNMKKLLGMRVC